MSKEFTVRAAGADRLYHRHLLGKFPDKVPDLKTAKDKDAWKLKLDKTEAASKEWLLEQMKGTEKYRGRPDAGLTGSGAANYFMLIKQKGSDDFLAIPADEICTFKRIYNKKELSLEDAEAHMAYQRTQGEKVNPKLALAIGSAEGGDFEAGGGGRDDDDADSDAEWKDIKARAASRPASGFTNLRAGVHPVSRRARTDNGDDDDGNEENDGGDEFVPRPANAEDWEHEAEAADDDLDMGQDEADGDLSPGPGRRPVTSSDSDEDDDERAADAAPQKVRKKLQRMLRQTGLSEDEDESSLEEEYGGHRGSAGGEGESDDDDDDDSDEDLDQMAEDVLTAQPVTAATTSAGASKKRKIPSSGDIQIPQQQQQRGVSQGAGTSTAGGGSQQAKRAKTAADIIAASNAVAAAAAGTASPVTEKEIVELLLAHTRLPLSEITAHFKLRVTSADDKKAFIGMVKRVAKLEPTPGADGQRYLILK